MNYYRPAKTFMNNTRLSSNFFALLSNKLLKSFFFVGGVKSHWVDMGLRMFIWAAFEAKRTNKIGSHKVFVGLHLNDINDLH